MIYFSRKTDDKEIVMDINKLLSGVDCACGNMHRCDIKYVFVERDAMKHLTEMCDGYENILIVADENTYGVGGEKTERYLVGKNLNRVIFPASPLLIPNELAIDTAIKKTSGVDLIIGIGSGVIQDLCKYVSHTTKIPYYIVATAPSMDGYASSGAAMITDGMKVTYSAKVPSAIIADTGILKDAPMDMIKAGYGDIIGKYSALNDWKLGAVVNGEYFCDYIYDLTYDMLLKVLPLAEKLLERDEDSIKTLMEALILVGVAMSFAGNSRPASGSEHHLSHYFEITGIVDGTEYLPHGIDVVYSTAVTSKIREKIKSAAFPKEQFVMNEDERKREISRVYKSVADGCIALQEKLGTYRDNRLARYRVNEEKIKNILSEAPTHDEIIAILGKIELDPKEFYNTYSEEKIRDAVRYAKDLKDRYTVLWMYYDVFGIEDFDK